MAPAMHYFIALLIMIGLIYLIDLLIVKMIIGRRWPNVAGSKLRLVVYILFMAPYILLFIPFVPHLFASEDERPSPVDASLITQLTPAQVEAEHIIKALESLSAHGYIRHFERNTSPLQRDWFRSYRISYVYDYMWVYISINFFWDEQRLIEYIPRWRHQHERINSEVIINENNTQVFLHASHVPISNGRPVTFRMIRTELRLGNVHIELSEDRSRDFYYPNASTAFIQLLYELLTAEQQPTPTQ